MINQIKALPAFDDNYIWSLLGDDNKTLCVVDPGDPTPVIKMIDEQSLTLGCILITHHHPDHTGGIAELTAKYSCKVYGPDNSSIAGITDTVKEGDEFTLLGETVSVLEVPGHTLDHIAFVVGPNAAGGKPTRLFPGDTLFAAGCGRLFEGTPAQMTDSLAKLTALGSETQVYCTHEYTQANLKFAIACEPGNLVTHLRIAHVSALREQGEITLPTTIGLELASNPFLRCSNQQIIDSAQSFSGIKPSDDVATFAAVRAWKDKF